MWQKWRFFDSHTSGFLVLEWPWPLFLTTFLNMDSLLDSRAFGSWTNTCSWAFEKCSNPEFSVLVRDTYVLVENGSMKKLSLSNCILNIKIILLNVLKLFNLNINFILKTGTDQFPKITSSHFSSKSYQWSVRFRLFAPRSIFRVRGFINRTNSVTNATRWTGMPHVVWVIQYRCLSGTFGVVEIKSDISIHKDVTRLFLI